MHFKKTLTLSFALLGIIAPCFAMKKEDVQPAPKNWVSRSLPLLLPNLLGQEIRVEVELEAPADADTQDKRLAYFDSRVPQTKALLQTVLSAYLTELKKQQNIELLKISPTSIYFGVDNHSLILREVYGTQQITPEFKAHLETRVACKYDPNTQTLTSEPYSLVVIPADTTQKQSIISVDALRELHGDETKLIINSKTKAQIAKDFYLAAMLKGMNMTGNRRNTELPNPNEEYRALYLQDILTLYKHYLSTQK